MKANPAIFRTREEFQQLEEAKILLGYLRGLPANRLTISNCFNTLGLTDPIGSVELLNRAFPGLVISVSEDGCLSMERK